MLLDYNLRFMTALHLCCPTALLGSESLTRDILSAPLPTSTLMCFFFFNEIRMFLACLNSQNNCLAFLLLDSGCSYQCGNFSLNFPKFDFSKQIFLLQANS